MAFRNLPMKQTNGNYLTQSLFIETVSYSRVENTYPPVFTLKDDDYTVDGVTYISLKKLYMSYDHVPGFEIDFANEVLGGWKHWQVLQKAKLFAPIIQLWQEEKEIKIRSDAMKAMITASKTDGSKAGALQKYLADKGWKPSRGRPSKEEVERERKIEAGVKTVIEDDLARIGLSVVAK